MVLATSLMFYLKWPRQETLASPNRHWSHQHQIRKGHPLLERCLGREDKTCFLFLKRQSTKVKLDATTVEVMKLVKATIENDRTKELITFMREEMEKSHEYELKLFQLMLPQRTNSTYDCCQGTPSSEAYHLGRQGITQPGMGFWNRPFKLIKSASCVLWNCCKNPNDAIK